MIGSAKMKKKRTDKNIMKKNNFVQGAFVATLGIVITKIFFFSILDILLSLFIGSIQSFFDSMFGILVFIPNIKTPNIIKPNI